MSNQKLLSIPIGILIIMFLISWNHSLPWLYFQFLRVYAMIIFGILAWYNNEKGLRPFAITFGLSLLTINPFIKVPMGRFYWNILDTIWAIILVVNIYILNKKQ